MRGAHPGPAKLLWFEKGVGSHLPKRPFGCFAQMTPDPFFNAHHLLANCAES